jgi:hypothetical protein
VNIARAVANSLLPPTQPSTTEQAEAVHRIKAQVEERQQITLYLSSPFAGMDTERDIFINRWLPILRHRTEQQGVRFNVIDLRWGVKADGSCTAHCLEHVLQSDMFIGFFGARYGTSLQFERASNGKRLAGGVSTYAPTASTAYLLDEFDAADKAGHRWVRLFMQSGRCVTELEFRLGWLNKALPTVGPQQVVPSMRGRGEARGKRLAAFFFRDARYDAAAATAAAAAASADAGAAGDGDGSIAAAAYTNHAALDEEKLDALKAECAECAPTTLYSTPTKAAALFAAQCKAFGVPCTHHACCACSRGLLFAMHWVLDRMHAGFYRCLCCVCSLISAHVVLLHCCRHRMVG